MTTIFTMRNLQTCLSPLKSSFDSNMKSHVVCELSCCGCDSTYNGQTCQHLTTKIFLHQKHDSQLGKHVVGCCGAPKVVFNYKRIDKYQEIEKYLTLEALHFSRCKLKLNTLDEYKSRALRLRY